MGRDNIVYTGAVLGEQPQHLRYRGEPTSLEIGDGNTFREHVTVHRGTTHSMKTVIGNHNFLMAGAHVAHDCVIGNHCIFTNGCLVAGHCIVADNVILSGNSAVHQFCHVGRLSLLSGCSATTKDMPPFVIQQGIDCVSGLNLIGMKHGLSSARSMPCAGFSHPLSRWPGVARRDRPARNRAGPSRCRAGNRDVPASLQAGASATCAAVSATRRPTRFAGPCTRRELPAFCLQPAVPFPYNRAVDGTGNAAPCNPPRTLVLLPAAWCVLAPPAAHGGPRRTRNLSALEVIYEAEPGSGQRRQGVRADHSDQGQSICHRPRSAVQPAAGQCDDQQAALCRDRQGREGVLARLRSTNGTFLNDEPVKGEVALANDDMVSVGPLTFKVVIEVQAAPSKPTPPPKPAAKNSEEDEAAALLMSLEAGSIGPATEESEAEVPGGSTVMDIPSFAPPEDGDKPKTKPMRKRRTKAQARFRLASRRRPHRPHGEPQVMHVSAACGVAAPLAAFQPRKRASSPTLNASSLSMTTPPPPPEPAWAAPPTAALVRTAGTRPALAAQSRDPYAIWVSEVMLQQTQVASVIPYFERVPRAFPSLAALAAADEQEVLRQWEGSAIIAVPAICTRPPADCVPSMPARFPTIPRAVRRLPGFGRYTANAVLSQAFDRRLPILEANSRRVLCRLFGAARGSATGPRAGGCGTAAETLLPRQRVGDFNQALMELGALVCTPAKPRLSALPTRGALRGPPGRSSASRSRWPPGARRLRSK